MFKEYANKTEGEEEEIYCGNLMFILAENTFQSTFYAIEEKKEKQFEICVQFPEKALQEITFSPQIPLVQFNISSILGI